MRRVFMSAITLLGAVAVAAVAWSSASLGPPSAPAAVHAQGPLGFLMRPEPSRVAEFPFQDATGKEVSLEQFKGRTVLLNIWATWCVPCREEMPALDNLQAALGGPSFTVIPLSIDRDGLDTVETFYADLGLKNLGMYVDASAAASRILRTTGIPTTVLLDPEGRELGRLVGKAEWDSPEMIAFLTHHIKRHDT